MTDDEITLPRRKILGALGSVGIASTAAGFGTSALLTDEDMFKDNGMIAGALDLKVDWQQRWYTGSEIQSETDPLTWQPIDAFPDEDGDDVQDSIATRDAIADDLFEEDFDALDTDEQRRVEQAFRDQFADVPDQDGGGIFTLEDIKPGDRGLIRLSLHLFDNPGYVWLTSDLSTYENAENGVNEPESKDEDENDPRGPDSGDSQSGELGDVIRVTAFYGDADGNFSGTLLGPGDANADTGGNATTDDVPEDFAELITDHPSAGLTLNELLDGPDSVAGRNNGLLPLDGDRTTPMAWDDGATADTRDCFDASTTTYLYLFWSLPIDHGNEIQTDSVTFDLGLYAEQCRHNDGSPPCSAQTLDLSTGTADWRVTESPDDTTGEATTTNPHPNWATSQCADWIDPYGNAPEEADPEGDYMYELDFEVNPFAGDCTLEIREFAADNKVTFFLDNEEIGGYTADTRGWEPPLSGPITADLTPGAHTLKAHVVNSEGGSGNPTGLLVCAEVDCEC